MSEELEISICDSSDFAEGLCQRNTLIVEGSCDFNSHKAESFGLVAAWLIFFINIHVCCLIVYCNSCHHWIVTGTSIYMIYQLYHCNFCV